METVHRRTKENTASTLMFAALGKVFPRQMFYNTEWINQSMHVKTMNNLLILQTIENECG